MANEGITWNHSNDVIFTKNSLENFINLIQAHADLTKIQFFSMRDGVSGSEFTDEEKTQHKKDIGIVRYDLPIGTNTDQNAQALGRHQFLRAGSDVAITTGVSLGTVKAQIDDSTTNIYVKGFSAVDNDANSVKFSGNFLPNKTDTYSLGTNTLKWKNIYANILNVSSIEATDALKIGGDIEIGGNITIGTAAKKKTFTINGRTIDFTGLPTATGAITQFLRGNGTWSNTLPNSLWSSDANATGDLCNGVIGNAGRIYFYSHGSNSQNHNIGIYGINQKGVGVSVLYITPADNTIYFTQPCHFNSVTGTTNVYGNTSIGTAANPVTVKINGRTLQVDRIPSSSSIKTNFWRGDGNWSNILEGPFWSEKSSGEASVGANAATGNIYLFSNDSYKGLYINKHGSGNAICVIKADTNNYVEIKGSRVYNAVFNDYAECRKTIDLEPGRVVVDNDDGSLSCSSQRLQPGAQVISDTYGNLMGETDDCKTPLAVAGRVLAYTYQPRENYHAGMAVCSAPNGTIDIMTREEIVQYPDCIMGIVSEIPEYDIWGTNEVKVDGRIWIKVR